MGQAGNIVTEHPAKSPSPGDHTNLAAESATLVETCGLKEFLYNGASVLFYLSKNAKPFIFV